MRHGVEEIVLIQTIGWTNTVNVKYLTHCAYIEYDILNFSIHKLTKCTQVNSLVTEYIILKMYSK